MDPESGGIPSVGCLLYVAADQLVAHSPSMWPFGRTRVPCKLELTRLGGHPR
jgi:hypothetical protein